MKRSDASNRTFRDALLSNHYHVYLIEKTEKWENSIPEFEASQVSKIVVPQMATRG